MSKMRRRRARTTIYEGRDSVEPALRPFPAIRQARDMRSIPTSAHMRTSGCLAPPPIRPQGIIDATHVSRLSDPPALDITQGMADENVPGERQHECEDRQSRISRLAQEAWTARISLCPESAQGPDWDGAKPTSWPKHCWLKRRHRKLHRGHGRPVGY